MGGKVRKGAIRIIYIPVEIIIEFINLGDGGRNESVVSILYSFMWWYAVW